RDQGRSAAPARGAAHQGRRAALAAASERGCEGLPGAIAGLEPPPGCPVLGIAHRAGPCRSGLLPDRGPPGPLIIFQTARACPERSRRVPRAYDHERAWRPAPGMALLRLGVVGWNRQAPTAPCSPFLATPTRGRPGWHQRATTRSIMDSAAAVADAQ